jgi:hypothetical protein
VLTKCGQASLGFVAEPGPLVELQRSLKRLSGVGATGLAQQELCLAERVGASLEDQGGELLGFRQQAVARDDPLDKPHAERPRGVDRLAQQQQLA